LELSLFFGYKQIILRRLVLKSITHIEVKIGDIFELMEKEQEQRKDELAVIGVNNYYDDDVDV
jgi:hypothetical protein